MFPLVRCIAMTLVLATPVTLRYHFKPGQTLRYRITEQAETSMQAGRQKSALMQRQDITTIVERRVLSVSGETGVVEERRQEGHSKTTKADGVTSTLVEPGLQVTTLTSLGVIVNMKRHAVPGIKDRGPQFLDGLAFKMPEKPVAPNAVWSGAAIAVGPDGKPMQVRYTSRYLGRVSKAGHPCAQIVTDYSAKLQVAGTSATAPTEGTLSGRYTAFLARDFGQEAASTGKLTLVYKASVKGADGAPVNVVRTVRLHFEQTLLK